MASTKPEVYVAGTRLSQVAPGWGALKVNHRWPHGCWEMSWSVPVRQGRRSRELQADREARCYYGNTPVWSGFLSEPNWDTGEMVALGAVRRGETALALDGSGAITTIPDLAIDQAYIRTAVDWSRRGSLSAAAFTDPSQSSSPIYLNALLDAWAKLNKVGWGVDARGTVYSTPDATVPSWLVSPDSGSLGVAEGALAKSVVGRYLVNPTTYANVRVGMAAPEVGVSLTKFGVINEATARAKAQAILDQIGDIRGWTNGLELAATQITSRGSVPANLAAIRAGQMMRLQGLRDERGRSAVTDIILGETTWDVAAQTILCNPVDMVARDLGSIVENLGGELLTGI